MDYANSAEIKMKKIFPITIIILVLLVLITYQYRKEILSKLLNKPSSNTRSTLQVVASFYPMYFFASEIGGAKTDVYNITPVGAEPHDYEPTTQNIAKITKSNMLVLNGGKLEAWGDKIKDQLQETNAYIVIAGGNLANNQVEVKGKTITDPHIWLDPVLAKQEADNIELGFERIDPTGAAYFQLNSKKLDEAMDKLNDDYKKGLSNCMKKDFVTSHAAFSYLAARYGLNQIAIAGVSPDEEPSPQKLAEITDLVKKENIKVIFFEKLASPKLSETIAHETGVQTLVLDPIEGLSDDELRKGNNYFTLMRNNLANLKIALQCKP